MLFDVVHLFIFHMASARHSAICDWGCNHWAVLKLNQNDLQHFMSIRGKQYGVLEQNWFVALNGLIYAAVTHLLLAQWVSKE